MADPLQTAKQAVEAFIAKAFEPGTLPPVLKDQLHSGSLSLLQLIRVLGEYLTSEDERIRSSGVELLAQVVIDLAPQNISLFDKQTVKTLSNFFAEKLEDGNNVSASISKSTNSAEKVVPASAPSHRFKAIPEGSEMLTSSLLSLIELNKLKGFGTEQVNLVINSLYSHIAPRDHPQLIRFIIYQLIDSLLNNHRNTLKAMGKSFLKGYIQLAEGEKDPRNLMYLFAIDRVLLIEWEIDTEMAEEFFDITYCYFPITFRPPPDDPYGITTEDLKSALRHCLTANPMLAPHAMPLLLEKLAASGGNTKRDTLETLQYALPVFGSAAVLANQKKLWEGFKVEIMAATDDETAVYAQRALASFLNVLYGHLAATDDQDGISTRIVSDALNELEAPEKSLAKPACDLLVAMVQACPATAHLAVYALLDQMLTLFKDPETVTVRAPILAHIASILKALRDVYTSSNEAEQTGPTLIASQQDSSQLFKFAAPSSKTESKSQGVSLSASTLRTYDGDGRPLDALRDELLAALSNGIQAPSYRSSALLAFVHLTHIPTFLSEAETNYMAESVNELILSPSADDVRGAALDGLRDIARVNPQVLEDTTLPLLFSRLPDRMPAEDAEGTSKGVVRRSLGALARLCVQDELFEMLVERLFTKLQSTCAASSTSAAEKEANVGYFRGLLVTILTVLEEKIAKGDKLDVIVGQGIAIPLRLFSLVLSSTGGDTAESSVSTDEKVIRDVGRLMTVVVRLLDVEKQTELAQWMYAVFLDGNVGEQGDVFKGFGGEFGPFEAGSATAQRNTLYLFSAAFVPLNKQVSLPGETTAWLTRVLGLILSATTTLQADAGYALLASSTNKYVTEPVPSDVLAVLDDFWHSHVALTGSDPHDSWTLDRISCHCRAIRGWFWLSKGLLVRNSKQGEVLFEQARETLFNNTISPYVATEAAKCTGFVAQSSDGILSKENNSVVRLLWKQKFFAYLVPRIIDSYNTGKRTNSDSLSSTSLIALASILPHLPRSIITERLPSLLPLLLQALDLSDAEARSSASTTITLAAAIGKKSKDDSIRSSTSPSTPNSLDLITDHLTSLLDRLLKCTIPSRASTTQTRIAALRCLATLARTIPFSTLKNHQYKVIKHLNGPHHGVDDPRKVVRVQAVDTKAVWHALV
ncbi:unnamed protein product [Sympodiomycopsis kandeliae]